MTEFIINFSGGKDSCAMLAYICETYPAARKHVVLADTGWEHKDTEVWCRSIVSKYGLELNVARNPNKDFFGMVRHRQKFPSPAQRQCTSDLKRGPIQTWTRRNTTSKLIINCLGLRAEESSDRAKKPSISRNQSMSNGKRTTWDWLPIQNWTKAQVLQYLADRNIPLHPVYKYLDRFSCRVCIFMTKKDLAAVQINDPEAFDTISSLEEEIGFTMQDGRSIIESVQAYEQQQAQPIQGSLFDLVKRI